MRAEWLLMLFQTGLHTNLLCYITQASDMHS